MTYLKKINPDWQPREHPGIIVGDVVDFPGPYQKLVEEGNVTLCDKDGNEISAYDALGVITNREMEEFKQWKKMQSQKALKASLEKEHDELVAAAEALKKAPVEKEASEDTKKKEWAAKMAAARAAKKATGGQANA